jgi:IS5 family transposase
VWLRWGFADDWWVQGRSDDQRELFDAESVAGHLLKSDSMFAFLAAHRGELFPEEMFADLFPSRRGRPSVPAEVMASVITLQALHGLSDNETVDAVTFDLRWKAACGLPITAGAFHSTTLTYWRRRLAASDRPNRIFEAVKAVVAQTGVLAGKTRRALDSTVLDDAVATQDTVTQLIAAIRRVRREVPAAAAVIEQHCTAHDYDDPGKPAIAWNDKAARDLLVDALVTDAHRVLGYLPEQELAPRAAEVVALLALIAGQDVEPVVGSDGTDGKWRIARKVAGDRVISTVDPDTRHVHKTVHHRQDGFKAHIAVEPDTGIITDCALRQATGSENHEAVVGVELLAQEDAGLQVLGDSAYGAAEARIALADAGHDALIKPIPLRTVIEGGLTRDDFLVDEAAATVTCPVGHTVAITRSRGINFGSRCRDCPLRARCTTSKRGRKLTLHEHDSVLFAARRQSETPEFQTVYRQHRPMVERSIAWIVRGNRKLRYHGTIKNDWWLHHRVAAVNLRRLVTMGLRHTGTNWATA